MARASTAPLTFRGTTFGLSAVLKEAPAKVGPVPIRLALSKREGGPIEAQAFPEEDARVVSMTLPRYTAPGIYKGTATVDGEDRPVVVELEPEIDVRLYPHQLTLRAHPKDLVGTDMTVLNMSNVPVDLRRVHAIGIFLEGGIERAIRRAYVTRLEKGQRRLDVLAETLASSHGGLLRAKIVKGSGTLKPQECRDIEVTFEVPGELEGGVTYTGNWELHNLIFPIRVVVAGDDTPGPVKE